MTLLLDTHAALWATAAPTTLSRRAREAIEHAPSARLAASSLYELAWIAERGAVTAPMGTSRWLEGVCEAFNPLPITPAIAATAAALPRRFPSDPADRLIYATAAEHGLDLVTKDTALRRYRGPVRTIW